jgi:hypothetical protein
MVFHPEPIPVYGPQIPHIAFESLKNPLPSIVKLDLEHFRDTILNLSEEGPMELTYKHAGLDLLKAKIELRRVKLLEE